MERVSNVKIEKLYKQISEYEKQIKSLRDRIRKEKALEENNIAYSFSFIEKPKDLSIISMVVLGEFISFCKTNNKAPTGRKLNELLGKKTRSLIRGLFDKGYLEDPNGGYCYLIDVYALPTGYYFKTEFDENNIAMVSFNGYQDHFKSNIDIEKIMNCRFDSKEEAIQVIDSICKTEEDGDIIKEKALKKYFICPPTKELVISSKTMNLIYRKEII